MEKNEIYKRANELAKRHRFTDSSHIIAINQYGKGKSSSGNRFLKINSITIKTIKVRFPRIIETSWYRIEFELIEMNIIEVGGSVKRKIKGFIYFWTSEICELWFLLRFRLTWRKTTVEKRSMKLSSHDYDRDLIYGRESRENNNQFFQSTIVYEYSGSARQKTRRRDSSPPQ